MEDLTRALAAVYNRPCAEVLSEHLAAALVIGVLFLAWTVL